MKDHENTKYQTRNFGCGKSQKHERSQQHERSKHKFWLWKITKPRKITTTQKAHETTKDQNTNFGSERSSTTPNNLDKGSAAPQTEGQPNNSADGFKPPPSESFNKKLLFFLYPLGNVRGLKATSQVASMNPKNFKEVSMEQDLFPNFLLL